MSALPILMERLQERLEGAEGLSDVTILWGPPVGDDTPAEIVMLGTNRDTESGTSDRDFNLIGGAPLDEQISLPITVQVIQAFGGRDCKAAYERSVEIAEAVEAEIRTDIGFENLLIHAAKLSSWTGRYLLAGEARGHQIFLTLTGKARI